MTFVHLPFSGWSLNLYFCRLTCVHEGHFMFCNNEEFQVELSPKIILWQIFIVQVCMISAAICMSPLGFCNLPCVYVLLRLISIARYAFKSPQICFQGTRHEVCHEHVANLHSIFSLGPAAIKTVCKYSR